MLPASSPRPGGAASSEKAGREGGGRIAASAGMSKRALLRGRCTFLCTNTHTHTHTPCNSPLQRLDVVGEGQDAGECSATALRLSVWPASIQLQRNTKENARSHLGAVWCQQRAAGASTEGGRTRRRLTVSSVRNAAATTDWLEDRGSAPASRRVVSLRLPPHDPLLPSPVLCHAGELVGQPNLHARLPPARCDGEMDTRHGVANRPAWHQPRPGAASLPPYSHSPAPAANRLETGVRGRWNRSRAAAVRGSGTI